MKGNKLEINKKTILKFRGEEDLEAEARKEKKLKKEIERKKHEQNRKRNQEKRAKGDSL